MTPRDAAKRTSRWYCVGCGRPHIYHVFLWFGMDWLADWYCNRSEERQMRKFGDKV